jgi:hypothetical protein
MMFGLAYGVNYLFDQKTYRQVVKAAIGSSFPWDDRLCEEHVRWCHFWPTRPPTSYIQHIVDADALNNRGDREKGAGFVMDGYNAGLMVLLTT